MRLSYASLSSLLWASVHGCAFDMAQHGGADLDPRQIQRDLANIATKNLVARDINNAQVSQCNKTVIRNVSVFDGHKMLSPRDIAIEAGRITYDINNAAQTIDGTGQTLMPGLIDSHIHPMHISDLQNLTRYGVTTGFMMACQQPELCASLKNQTGLTDVIAGSCPASAPGSMHAKMLGLNTSTCSTLSSASQAASWVSNQLSQPNEPTFIKIITEQNPGLSTDILSALTSATHSHHSNTTTHARNSLGVPVIAHAADTTSIAQALAAKVDQIHHTPLDGVISNATAQHFLSNNAVSCPTLVMMQATANVFHQSQNFPNAVKSVTALHNARARGMPSPHGQRITRENRVDIIAGTDSNNAMSGLPKPLFGSALHDELELLVSAGMTPLEVLQAATSRPARVWGLRDRGVVQEGKRADVVLVKGDPTKDIKVSREITGVWVEGVAWGGPFGDGTGS